MNQKQKDFDVIIVGGGAVGGALALALIQQGYHKIAVLEASETAMAKTNPERVVALSHGSRCFLEGLGVWDEISQAGCGHIRHIDVREAHNHGLVQMHATDVEIEALGYVIDIADIVAPIERALESNKCIFRGANLLSMQTDAQGVRVQVQYQGDTLHLSAALLIGADGTNSQVRRMAGIGTHGWDHNRFALVASVGCERGHGDTAYECFHQAGPLAFLPLADDRFSIVWALSPHDTMRLLDMPEKMFLKRLQRAADESVLPCSGRFVRLSKRASFALELRVAKEYVRDRIALVGNAAHTVHPVAGQGMNLGLRDVAVLAALLGQKQSFSADASLPLTLQAYAEQRRLDVLAVAGFTESMLAGFSSNLSIMRYVRSQGLAAVQMLSPLRDGLLQHASGLTQMISVPNEPEVSVGERS